MSPTTLPPLPEADGALITIPVPNPAPGSDFEFTVPAGQLIRIRSVYYTLTTDGNAANRLARIALNLNGLIIPVSLSMTALTALTTTRISHLAGLGQASAINNESACIPLPPTLDMDEFNCLTSQIRDLQAGDQISDIRITYRAWRHA